MKKVIFNRQPWPFPWIMNEYLDDIRWSYFLIPSDRKTLARWEANSSEENPVCLQRRTFVAGWVKMCTVHQGLCAYWQQDLQALFPQGERITSENKPNAVRRSRMTRRTLYYCHGWHTNQRVEKQNTCKWRKRRQLAWIVCLKIIKVHKYEFFLTLEQEEGDFLCALRQYLCLSCTSKQKPWRIHKYTLNADNYLLQHVSSSPKCSWSHSFSGADKNKNIPTCYVCWYATWNKSAER